MRPRHTQEKLDLDKVNAQILLYIELRNRLIKGQMGTIEHICKTELTTLQKFLLKLMMLNQVWKKDLQFFFAKQNSWGPIKITEINSRIPSISVVPQVITGTQFLWMLVWGYTVHNAQGLTLEEIVVSFDLLKEKQFNGG